MNRIPFDIEKVHGTLGVRVETRDGQEVTQIKLFTDLKPGFDVITGVAERTVLTWREDGRFHRDAQSRLDLFLCVETPDLRPTEVERLENALKEHTAERQLNTYRIAAQRTTIEELKGGIIKRDEQIHELETFRNNYLPRVTDLKGANECQRDHIKRLEKDVKDVKKSWEITRAKLGDQQLRTSHLEAEVHERIYNINSKAEVIKELEELVAEKDSIIGKRMINIDNLRDNVAHLIANRTRLQKGLDEAEANRLRLNELHSNQCKTIDAMRARLRQWRKAYRNHKEANSLESPGTILRRRNVRIINEQRQEISRLKELLRDLGL